jgi:hypothetical protein
LFEERTEEVNLAQLLRDAVRDFNPAADTIDEQQVEDEWPELSAKLRYAEGQFREWHPPIADPLFTGTARVSVDDVRAAIAALADPAKPRRTAAKPQRKVIKFSDDSDTDAQIRALLEQIEGETL